MERRFRVSPAMVVAALALVIAAFCLLYVVEQRGAIAIGSPSPNGIRVIEAGQVGAPLYEGTRTSSYCGDAEAVYWPSGWYSEQEAWFGRTCGTCIWSHRKVTVPEGKIWMIIVSLTTLGTWIVYSHVREPYRFPFSKRDIRPAGYFLWEEGGKHYQSGVLEAGNYDDVGLYVIGYRSGPDNRYYEPVVYLVLEVDT